MSWVCTKHGEQKGPNLFWHVAGDPYGEKDIQQAGMLLMIKQVYDEHRTGTESQPECK